MPLQDNSRDKTFVKIETEQTIPTELADKSTGEESEEVIFEDFDSNGVSSLQKERDAQEKLAKEAELLKQKSKKKSADKSDKVIKAQTVSKKFKNVNETLADDLKRVREAERAAEAELEKAMALNKKLEEQKEELRKLDITAKISKKQKRKSKSFPNAQLEVEPTPEETQLAAID